VFIRVPKKEIPILSSYDIHKTASGQEYYQTPIALSPADTELPQTRFRSFAKTSFEIFLNFASPQRYPSLFTLITNWIYIIISYQRFVA